MDRYPIAKAGEQMSPFSQVKTYAASLKQGESEGRSKSPSERLSAPRTCTVLLPRFDAGTVLGAA